MATDIAGDPFIHVYERDNFTRQSSFGRRGEGPGDFGQVPTPVDGTGPRGEQWLLDNLLRRVSSMPDTLTGSARFRTIALPDIAVRDAVALPSGTLLISAVDSTHAGFSFISFDPNTGVATRTAALELKDERFPPGDRLSAYRHQLCLRPGGNQVATIFFHASRIDIRDTTGTWQVPAATPFNFLPIPEPHPLTRRPGFKNGSPHVRFAYLDCTATRDHLYALFSGDVVGTRSASLTASRSAVHVFDWAGRLVRNFVLDHAAHSIAVDRDGGALFSVWSDSEGAGIRLTTLPLLGSSGR